METTVREFYDEVRKAPLEPQTVHKLQYIARKAVELLGNFNLSDAQLWSEQVREIVFLLRDNNSEIDEEVRERMSWYAGQLNGMLLIVDVWRMRELAKQPPQSHPQEEDSGSKGTLLILPALFGSQD